MPSVERCSRDRAGGATPDALPRPGTSLNKTILSLLSERLGLSKDAAPARYEDLDELAGTWSKAEASRFEEALQAQRQVDARLWR